MPIVKQAKSRAFAPRSDPRVTVAAPHAPIPGWQEPVIRGGFPAWGDSSRGRRVGKWSDFGKSWRAKTGKRHPDKSGPGSGPIQSEHEPKQEPNLSPSKGPCFDSPGTSFNPPASISIILRQPILSSLYPAYSYSTPARLFRRQSFVCCPARIRAPPRPTRGVRLTTHGVPLPRYDDPRL